MAEKEKKYIQPQDEWLEDRVRVLVSQLSEILEENEELRNSDAFDEFGIFAHELSETFEMLREV